MKCVCVCACMCACARLDARMFWTLLMCLRVYVSGRSRVRRVGRECESEIFTYLFYIYCYFKCTFLSPCFKGKFSFLCLVYWWIIKTDLIWWCLTLFCCCCCLDRGGGCLWRTVGLWRTQRRDRHLQHLRGGQRPPGPLAGAKQDLQTARRLQVQRLCARCSL